MDDLQDNIIRVLDFSETQCITQQEAWDTLITLELIDSSMDKDYFLEAYLKIIKEYNDIYLEIVDNRYYLKKKVNFTPKINNVFFSFSMDKLTEFIVKTGFIPFDTILSQDGNTVTHYIVIYKNEEGIKKAKVSDFLITNQHGLSSLDYLGDSNTSIFKEIISKLNKDNDELKVQVNSITKQLNTSNKCIKFLRSKFETPVKHYITYAIIFSILVKFLINKIFY